MSGSLTVTKAGSATAFIASIAVNTHTGTWDAAYGLPNGSGGYPAKIEAELSYLGIDSIRDTVQYAWQLPEYQQLAAAGVKFDLFIGASPNAGSLTTQIGSIVSLAPDVRSVEGPNESDNWPVTYDGLTGLPATWAMQTALYALVRSTSALAGVPVLEASLGNAASYAALAGLGNATDGNTHSYFFTFSQTIAAQIPPRIAQEGIVAPGLPTVATEAGWSSAASAADYGSVDLATQAKLTLDLLLDQFNAGVSVTYLYQLMDQPAQNDTNGLFYVDGSAKPVATALHNLTTILSDGNSATAPVTPGSLVYSVSGMPATGESSLLEQANGTFDLSLWNEAPIWNPVTETEIAVSVVPVTVTLGAVYATVSLYDPMLGSTAITVWHNVSSIQVGVMDHPQILEILANPPPAPAISGLTAATDTGWSSSDGITSDATPVVLGAALAGSTVTLFSANGAPLGTATAGAATGGGATGTWSVAVSTALAAGTYGLTATATASTATASTATASTGTSAVSAAYTVTIDTTTPTVSAIASTVPAGGVLDTGQTDSFTLTISEPVAVTGSPTLMLSDGGVATYDVARSRATALVFDTVVAAGQISNDLGIGALALNNGSITDVAGNALSATNLATMTGSSTGVQVNPGPPTVKAGSGSDTLAITVNEDFYLANALFTVTVDGQQIGGTLTTTAIRALAQTQVFDVEGSFGAGQHVVAVDFLNDAYAGTAATDRNLYVTSASIDGAGIPGATMALKSNGSESFAFGQPAAPIDTLTLNVSEAAFQGNAQFTVTVDGKAVGGVQTATALQAAGATNQISLAGDWGLGAHTIGITFINAVNGGTPATDRSLYVASAVYDGVQAASTNLTLLANGTQMIAVAATAAADVLTLNMAEDAYNGDAKFTVAVDGRLLGGPQMVDVLNSSGGSEAFSFNDILTAGTHDVAVSFINDAYGGTSAMDRNLYVKGATLSGSALSGWAAALDSNSTKHFSLVVP